MLDFAECERLVSTARDKQSKPIAHNTRVERRDADTYALRFHATDIATFHRDGRITLNSGGWRTNTTKNRLDGYVTRHLYSDHGSWYVDAEPDPRDPKPPRGERRVLKPFHALDPGPEPVKPAEGCLAGTERVARELRRLWIKEEERRDDDVTLEHSQSGYFTGGYVEREITVGTIYYETKEETWGYHGQRRPGIEGAEETKHEQCPHCALFDAQHRIWDEAMNGGGWGRNRTHGYRAMVENLERYGSREAWQEAYLADFRAAREARKTYKAWVDRNHVLFHDGIELTSEGYAQRPDPKEVAREQREIKRIAKAKRRISKFVDHCVDELKAGNVPMPSGGDCWYCSMQVVGTGAPLGDLSGGHEHLHAHIDEGYVVPSMLVNAMRERGYKDAGIYMLLEMDPDNDRMGGGGRERFEPVARALRAYLTSRLVPNTAGSAPSGAAYRETSRAPR